MARILIVEDSSAMRAYVRSALEEQAAWQGGQGGQGGEVEVVEAVSGFDALRLLPRGAFDLLITDINMPDINGLELIRFVRQSESYGKLAVLIISTQAAQRDVTRGLSLGADGFLPKPFTPEALRRSVSAALTLRAAGRPATGPPGAARSDAPGARSDAPGARSDAPGARSDAVGGPGDEVRG